MFYHLDCHKPLQSNHFSGIFIGKNRITLERTASTNDYLKAELSKFKPLVDGTVIMAVEQYAGRGQLGTQWESEKGKNLTASILLCPSFISPANQFNLSIAVSLGIRHVLHKILKQDVWIKWPNDIYVNNKKIGGLLIENILQGNTWKHAIIGIGINVNQTIFSSDAKHPTSISEILHESYSIEKLIVEICKLIELHYFELKSGMQNKQKEEYLQYLLGKDKQRIFKIDGISVEGKIVDIDTNGRLVVDFNGHLSSFSFKEIEYQI